MPNKRKHGKRILNVWVPADIYARFAAWAEEQGVSMSELIVRYMRDMGTDLSPAAKAAAERRMKEAVKRAAMKKVLRVAGDVADAVMGTYIGGSTIGPLTATKPMNVFKRQENR